MADDVPHGVKKERANQLRLLAEANRKNFADSFAGLKLAAALESGRDSAGNIIGLTDNYLRVALNANNYTLTPGRVVEVYIESYDGDVLHGYTNGR